MSVVGSVLSKRCPTLILLTAKSIRSKRFEISGKIGVLSWKREIVKQAFKILSNLSGLRIASVTRKKLKIFSLLTMISFARKKRLLKVKKDKVDILLRNRFVFRCF